MQFYTGNFLDGTITGKGGHVYQRAERLLPRDAALPGLAEPAEVPVDDPAPGQAYESQTVFTFGVAK